MSCLQMQGDARSRRAGMVDPKPSILLCCRVLRAAAASSLSPELLRRAKFDSPDSVRTLCLFGAASLGL